MDPSMTLEQSGVPTNAVIDIVADSSHFAVQVSVLVAHPQFELGARSIGDLADFRP
jgi:hypothetical protein